MKKKKKHIPKDVELADKAYARYVKDGRKSYTAEEIERKYKI